MGAVPSHNIIHSGNYVIWPLSDSLKPMAGWLLQWLSTVRVRQRRRRDLLLECIILLHQIAILQRTGTRRPCFRSSDRMLWVLLSRWWANWQRSLIIVHPATVLRWRMWGIPGVILSVPMLAITKIICDRVRPLAAFGHFLEG